MRYNLLFSAFIFLVCFSSLSSDAETNVYLKAGDTKVLPCPSCQEVSIDNPNIADVTTDGDSVIVSAVSPGITALEYVSGSGKKDYKVVVWEDNVPFVANQVRSLLKVLNLSNNISVGEDKLAGKVYLLGEISGEEKQKALDNVLQACPSPVIVNLVKVKDQHEVIEVKVNVAEISKSDLDQLGIAWPSSISLIASEDVPSESGEESNGKSLGDALKFNKWTRNDATWMLSMLEQQSKGKILASPSILATSGKEASILVGGEIPILMYDDDEPKVEFRPYGIILNILPSIIEGNKIDVNLECEVSEIDWTNSVNVTLAGDDDDQRFNVPAFTKRNAKTEVILNNGESIIMGGLLKNTDTKITSGVPGLSKLPVLGALFSSKDFQKGKTELIITLTPKIKKGNDSTPAENLNQLGGLQNITLNSDKSPLQRYKEMLLNTITKSFYYPDYVKDKKLSGTVLLTLHIARSGRVLGVRVKSSSGSKVLDRLAIMLIRDIGLFPPFPGDLNLEDLWIDIPIIYQA